MAWKRARRRRLEVRATLLQLVFSIVVAILGKQTPLMLQGLSNACALVSCLITSVLLIEENLNSETFCSWGLLSGVCEARAARSRAATVRQAMVHAWAGYRLDAWGANEIHPVSRKGKFEMTVGALALCNAKCCCALVVELFDSRVQGFANMSVSLIDAMSTLKLMGLDKEFDECASSRTSFQEVPDHPAAMSAEHVNSLLSTLTLTRLLQPSASLKR